MTAQTERLCCIYVRQQLWFIPPPCSTMRVSQTGCKTGKEKYCKDLYVCFCGHADMLHNAHTQHIRTQMRLKWLPKAFPWRRKDSNTYIHKASIIHDMTSAIILHGMKCTWLSDYNRCRVMFKTGLCCFSLHVSSSKRTVNVHEGVKSLGCTHKWHLLF